MSLKWPVAAKSDQIWLWSGRGFSSWRSEFGLSIPAIHFKQHVDRSSGHHGYSAAKSCAAHGTAASHLPATEWLDGYFISGRLELMDVLNGSVDKSVRLRPSSLVQEWQSACQWVKLVGWLCEWPTGFDGLRGWAALNYRLNERLAGWVGQLSGRLGSCLGALMSSAWRETEHMVAWVSEWVGECLGWHLLAGWWLAVWVGATRRMKLGSRFRWAWWVWVWVEWEVDWTTVLPSAYYYRNTRIFTGGMKRAIPIPNPRGNAVL
jgi:hypothetical protein